MQAYSSLGAADGWPVLAKNVTINEVAQKYGKSVPQILLKWALQHNLCKQCLFIIKPSLNYIPFVVAIIPKTSKVENVKPNFDLFDFEISSSDMAAIDALHDKNRKFCWDPSNIRWVHLVYTFNSTNSLFLLNYWIKA